MSETDVERHLKKLVEGLGGIAFKFKSPGYLGVPDRLCVLPSGKIFFVEVKDRNGKVNTAQHRCMNKLKHMRQDVYVVWSVLDVDLLMKGYQ